MSSHFEIRDLPHHRSFATLGSVGRAAVAASLLRGLGFDPRPPEPLEGLSGLPHQVPLIGVDAERRRIVAVQAGAEALARFYHEPKERLPRPSSVPPRPTPEQERNDWLKRSLFTTFDLKAAFERAGWSFNSLFVFNSFEVPSGMTDAQRSEWWKAHAFPRDTTMTTLGGNEPLTELNVAFLRDRVIAAGASFVDANQLGFEDIGRLARPSEDVDFSVVKAVLSRVRLSQFFRPPLDELLLGTLNKAGHMDVGELEKTGSVAVNRGHEIAGNTLVPRVSSRDPEETIRSLKDLRMVSFKRSEFFIEPSGKAVVQEWEKTAQESLFVKILRELRLPAIIEAMIRGIGGSAG